MMMPVAAGNLISSMCVYRPGMPGAALFDAAIANDAAAIDAALASGARCMAVLAPWCHAWS